MITGTSAAQGVADPSTAADAGGVDTLSDVRMRAESGDAAAQCSLGCIYWNGQGVPGDHAEAAKWIRMSADQNFAEAQYYLGVMSEAGDGMPKDAAEAMKWYRKAADQGNSWARSSIRA